VLLDAPDTVLIERANGKRVDPETGGNFENIFFSVAIGADTVEAFAFTVKNLWVLGLTFYLSPFPSGGLCPALRPSISCDPMHNPDITKD